MNKDSFYEWCKEFGLSINEADKFYYALEKIGVDLEVNDEIDLENLYLEEVIDDYFIEK